MGGLRPRTWLTGAWLIGALGCALGAPRPVLAAAAPTAKRERTPAERCAAGHARSCVSVAASMVQAGKVAEAMAPYDAACQRGHARACFNLAILLRRDPALVHDEGRISELLHSACAGGHARACKLLERPATAPDQHPAPSPAIAALQRRCNRLDERACDRLGAAYARLRSTRKLDGEHARRD